MGSGTLGMHLLAELAEAIGQRPDALLEALMREYVEQNLEDL